MDAGLARGGGILVRSFFPLLLDHNAWLEACGWFKAFRKGG